MMLNRRSVRASRGVVFFLAIGAVAVAGPIWCEPAPGDAGSLPPFANSTKGIGTNALIKGELSGFSAVSARGVVGTGDFEDLFLIRIVDPKGFFASTANPAPGLATEFDSQLFLFDFQGRGLLGSRDDPNSPDGGATLRPFSNDGSGVEIDQPGLYYLAITGQGNDPFNNAGAPIFQFVDPFEISGPDAAPPNMRRVEAWMGDGPVGEYFIQLQGVSFAENPCPGDCDTNGIVDFDDLICMLFDFGSARVGGDCDVNGVVDFNDLICALFHFGPCEQTFSEE